MGRKTQVTREQLLDAGMQIIIRDGYSGVSVKNVAAELNCSTSPMTWSFDTIDNYKKELRTYVINQIKSKLTGDGEEIPHYKKTAKLYIDMAIDTPNLMLYLRSDKEIMESLMSNRSVFDDEKNTKYREKWAIELDMSEQDALECVQFMSVYLEGMVSLVLADRQSIERNKVYEMLEEAEKASRLYIANK